MMPFVTTTSNYCFLECDRSGCNRKMEHREEKALKRLASLCGWDKKGDEWICPNCVEEIRSKKDLGIRTRRVPRAA
jgi:hypothetical protein